MDRKQLRERAEARRRKGAEGSSHATGSLELHEIELELQDEELQRRLRELENASARYQQLFDAAPMPFVAIDAYSVIIAINAAAAQLLQTDRESSLGTRIDRYLHLADVVTYHHKLRQASESDQPQAAELELSVGPRRLAIPVRVQIVPVPATRRGGYVISMVDLSDVRRAEASVDSERRRIEAIFDAAVDAIVTLDASGAIAAFNPAAERMFGRTASEAAGRPVRELVSSSHGPVDVPFLEGLTRTAIHDTPFARELAGRRADGSTFPIHVSIAKLPGEGFCAFIRDLTEVKVVEDELRHAHKMEAIGTLASGVAHDFNNLLMGMAGCAEIAMASLEPDSIARLYLEEIVATAASGVEITRQLLTFSRREGGLSPGIFELNELIARQVNMLARMIGEDIDLRVELDAPESRVRADPGQITQILMNLAINARDAMPDGGILEIRTAQCETHDDGPGRPGGHHVALQVSDTGCGMAESIRQRAFDPFFTSKPRGTGLGLSTVYGIVKQARGSIAIESEEGRGTTFEILFPLSKKTITQDFPPAPSRTLAGGDETVLVVEDEPLVRMVLKSYLERAGYHVLEAGAGEEAVDCSMRYPRRIDLLVTDMVLPQMNGDRLAAEIARHRPGTPALFLSAHDRRWLRSRGSLPEGAPVLQKPVGADVLLSAVRALLDGDPIEAADIPAATEPVPSIGTVLVIEDTTAERRALEKFLALEGWEVLAAASAREAKHRLREHGGNIDALVTGYRLPDDRGDAVAREVREGAPDVAVVYMTTRPDLADVEPAGTILQKPVDLERVAEVLASSAARLRC